MQNVDLIVKHLQIASCIAYINLVDQKHFTKQISSISATDSNTFVFTNLGVPHLFAPFVTAQ